MKKLIFMFIAVFVLSGCAKMPVRGEYTILDAAPILEVDNEAAIVYFLRENAFIGGGVTYYIWEDTSKIGLLRSGSYFTHKSKPGLCTYWAETEAKTTLTLNVDAGKTYYILGGVNMGVLIGRATLSEVSESVAKELLPNLKYTRLSTPEEYEAYEKKNSE